MWVVLRKGKKCTTPFPTPQHTSRHLFRPSPFPHTTPPPLPPLPHLFTSPHTLTHFPSPPQTSPHTSTHLFHAPIFPPLLHSPHFSSPPPTFLHTPTFSPPPLIFPHFSTPSHICSHICYFLSDTYSNHYAKFDSEYFFSFV